MSYWVRLSPKEAANHGIPYEIAKNINNYFYGESSYTSLPTPTFIDGQFSFIAFVVHPKNPNIARLHSYRIDELWDFKNPLEEPEYSGMSLNPSNVSDTLHLLVSFPSIRSMHRSNRQCFIPLNGEADIQRFHIRRHASPEYATEAYFQYVNSPLLENQDRITLIEFSKAEIPHWPAEKRWGLGVGISQFTSIDLENHSFSPFDHGEVSYIDLDTDGFLALASLIQAQLNFD